MKKLMFSLFAAMMLIGVQAMAQDATNEKPVWMPSISLTFEYASRYMSDGKIVNPESMLFGDISLGWDFKEFGGIYVGTWVANDWNDWNEGDKVQYEPEEIDYYIGYYYTLNDVPVVESLTFDLSYAYWDYPKRTKWPSPGETERKVVLDISTADFAIGEAFTWHPGFYVGWDHENDEWQAKPYVKSSYKVMDKLTFNNSLELFWFNARWMCGGGKGAHHTKVVYDDNGEIEKVYPKGDAYKNGFYTLVFGADLTYQITENISFGPFAKLAWVLDHDYRETWKDKDNPYYSEANSKSGMNTLWGVKLSISF